MIDRRGRHIFRPHAQAMKVKWNLTAQRKSSAIHSIFISDSMPVIGIEISLRDHNGFVCGNHFLSLISQTWEHPDWLCSCSFGICPCVFLFLAAQNKNSILSRRIKQVKWWTRKVGFAPQIIHERRLISLYHSRMDAFTVSCCFMHEHFRFLPTFNGQREEKPQHGQWMDKQMERWPDN